MLKKQLTERYTAKWWDPIPVDNESLNYILDCAYFSPSKQGKYNYKIYVLTDTDKSVEFKNWLYWENTWCLDKIRIKQGQGLKRFNGQVLAPIVLMWVANNVDLETRDDCFISASIAMCAALEKNLQTGLNSCIGPGEIAEKLSIAGNPVVCLGVGHATSDKLATRAVYLDNKLVGFDLSNTEPQITKNYNRVNKPKFSDLIIYL
jgi:nitroreductase